jgi:hypothetical protein
LLILRIRPAQPEGNEDQTGCFPARGSAAALQWGNQLRKQQTKQANNTREKSYMGEKFMSPRIALTVSTLALGTALTAVPALAQGYGSGGNNGQQYQYQMGRAMNDGGYPVQNQNSGAQQTGSVQRRTAHRTVHRSTAAAQPSSAASPQGNSIPSARAMNDGGFQPQQTASAQNAGPGPGSAGPNYAYGPPNTPGPGPYDYYNAPGPNYAGVPMYQGAIAACQVRFRSYDPTTGTFLGFDGIRHSCP